MTRNQDRVAVVIGASSGIGRASALRFARHSYRIVLASRDAGTLEVVARETRRLGSPTLIVPTDISDETQVQGLVDAAVSEFGRIDAWVCAASVFAYGRFEDVPADVFRKIIDTNLIGVISSVRAVLPVFRAQGRGGLILVGSVFSKVAAPYTSGYIASKHGLLGFAEALRPELPRGISLSLILPTTIDTPIYQHGANFTGKEVHALPPAVAPERVARAIVRSARRPRRQVVVGQTQRLTIPLQILFPTLFARLTQPALLAIALRKGPVADSDGNVFAPTPESNGISGGWRRRRRIRLASAGLVAASLLAILRVVGARTR
ncbi:SDR family NAD(P)-dependent oxidoreductase [Amnibacterium flavum]|uniref:Short-chain dehydrogenase n=1 Tax=Amnibacterium flavum TaxID=2173173 RepID=A0A2V1HNQ0_9MICO|nr:SDR family NAD(P)-dependent oxidoreductase [Amnibacterium flavum]PVZ94216.1 hypothetical protein DDQ50_10760 [Amnibacterium flavum]